MSSSSSDSDSDNYEPIRKIKINIRPLEVGRRKAADVSEIKASIEAIRPLAPPPHPSLARRQSSLSSVASASSASVNNNLINSNNYSNVSIGFNQAIIPARQKTTASIQSSPSCSSLVTEFNNKLSFTNHLLAAAPLGSPPITLANDKLGNDNIVPIAIAIQESIELVVKGHFNPDAREPIFQSCLLGNIKVAFPNFFASGNLIKTSRPTLTLRVHSTDKIIKYYPNRLIKDLDFKTARHPRTLETNLQLLDCILPIQSQPRSHPCDETMNSNGFSQPKDDIDKLFDLDTFSESMALNSYTKLNHLETQFSKFKVIELDDEALAVQLKKMNEASPSSKYYNVDILRYQIAPLVSIEESPLQVCAYWKIESHLVKLRIDFKHSIKSGFKLDRLRNISFSVNFSEFIPVGVEINSLQSNSRPNHKLNNNNPVAMNMNDFESNDANDSGGLPSKLESTITERPISTFDHFGEGSNSTGSNISGETVYPQDNKSKSKLFPLIQKIGRSHLNEASTTSFIMDEMKPFRDTKCLKNATSKNFPQFSSDNSYSHIFDSTRPYLNSKPEAHWDNSMRQLIWKFDSLASYSRTEGLGSLFAKLDFRNFHGMPPEFLKSSKPAPISIRFLVTDSTMSRINISVDSIGYKMSLLKKEIRSGRYKSEPFIIV